MFKRGSTTKRSAKQTRVTAMAARGRGARTKYRQQMIEALEERQLLTTLYGGGAGRVATYTYSTPGAGTAQVSIFGNVTAEFIFVDGSGNVTNPDVVFNGPGGVNNGTGGFVLNGGLDLFQVFVAQSDINSYISIENVGTSDPFGSVTSITIRPANPKSTTITASSGSGALRLGALSGGSTGAPVIKTDSNGAAIGVRPAGLDDLPDDPYDDLSAGLIVANGHDLGKFMFDGEVFGKVHVDGSMNLFYAGWLLTGDARGASEGNFGASGLPVSLVDQFVTPQDAALGSSRHIVPRQNFFVGGDLQNLVSDGAIGWDATFGDADPDLAPFYLSGTDIYVRGRLGQIQANKGNAGTVTVLNLDPATGGFVRPVVYQEELEGYWHEPNLTGIANDITIGFPNTSGFDFGGGVLYGPRTGRGVVPVGNDSFTSFQLLNGFTSPRGNDIIDLIGALDPQTVDADPIDFYGVSLLAGQTITIQALQTFGNNNLHVGVLDPDGRLIASDYSDVRTPNTATTNLNQLPFQITADRPGIYRIAIAEGGDVNFVGTPSSLSFEQYELVIGGAVAMGAGGVTVNDQFGGAQLNPGGPARTLDSYPGQHQFEVDNGDFGGVYISAQFNTTVPRTFVPTAPPAPGTVNFATVFGTVYVPAGNLRTMDASQFGVGTLNSETTQTGLDLNVPNGSVGLVQGRDANAVLALNPSVRLDFANTIATATVPTTPTTPAPFTPAALSIGGNYQVINAAGRFYGAVAAKGGMGTLRAGTIAGIGNQQTFIYLDTDSTGFDGKSDLIDVTGDIDGPALLHGPGGNFRYFRVGGLITWDPFFGGGANHRQVANYGQSVSYPDDSGSIINLTPVGNPIANPAFNPQDPSQGPQFFLPQLSTQTYPVRTGGVIVMDVASTGSLAVNSQGNSSGSTAEISRIEVHGNGAAPARATTFSGNQGFVTTLTEPFTSQALNNDLSVVITGSATTDVAYIAAMTPEPTNNFYLSVDPPLGYSSVTTFGNATLISNNTGGEILTVHAATLGTLTSNGTVGVTRTTTIPGNSLNFIDPLTIGAGYTARTATPVVADGAVVGNTFPFSGQTYGIAINGDIVQISSARGLGNIVTNGIIGSVRANADGKNDGSEFEGINAPIVAYGTTSRTPLSSGLQSGSILSVNIGEGIGSSGSGNFARTGIFAAEVINSITGNNADIRGMIEFGRRLDHLALNNGSLIDADIINNADLGPVFESNTAGSFLVEFATGGMETNITNITINGAGQGIIGTLIDTNSIQSISIPKGFGILDSQIFMAASGFIGNVTVGGYGIRNTTLNGGMNIGSINVTGNGSNLSTNQVTPSVRQSEFVRVDPQFNFGFDPFSGRPLTPNNDIHSALGTNQSSPVIPGVTNTGVVEDSRIVGTGSLNSIKAQIFRGDPAYNRIAFGNSIGTLQSRGAVHGLAVVTGRIKKLQLGSDVQNLQLSFSNAVNNLTIKGSLGPGSVIEATGPNGRIGNLKIAGSLNGTIHATQTINTITIGKNLNGSLKIDDLSRNGIALKKLQVGGTIENGSLDIGGDGIVASVGQIIVGKSLGASAADSVDISGSIDKLQVGGTLAAAVNVGGKIGTLQAQTVTGPLHAGGNFQNLIVKKGGLSGDVTVGNVLQKATIVGGISGNVAANNGIGTITVNGNVAAGKTISSDFGSIDTLKVSGNLFASVTSAGKINAITVGGNLGDGATPLTISATRLGLLQVGGSIKNGVTIQISGPIDALVVGKDVDAGAVIQASALNKQQIGGQVFGNLLIG